jgi:hypothetical protein
MRVSYLIVGVAIGAIGVAQAHARHHHRITHGYAAPARPIPYTELDAYVGVRGRAAVEPVSYADMGTATDTAAADEDRNWAAAPPPARPRTSKSEVANPIGMMGPSSSSVQPNYSHPQPH